ncbi:MAG: hypothetical protein WCT31_00300 [Candidatus Micrarchaeia archaeon]
MGSYYTQIRLANNQAVRLLVRGERDSYFSQKSVLSVFSGKLLGPDDQLLSVKDYLQLHQDPTTACHLSEIGRLVRLSDYAFLRTDPRQKLGGELTWAEGDARFRFVVPVELRNESGIGLVPLELLHFDSGANAVVLDPSAVPYVHLFNSIPDAQNTVTLIGAGSEDNPNISVTVKPAERYKNGADGWHGSLSADWSSRGLNLHASSKWLDSSAMLVLGMDSPKFTLLETIDALRDVVRRLNTILPGDTPITQRATRKALSWAFQDLENPRNPRVPGGVLVDVYYDKVIDYEPNPVRKLIEPQIQKLEEVVKQLSSHTGLPGTCPTVHLIQAISEVVRVISGTEGSDRYVRKLQDVVEMLKRVDH